MSAPEPIKMLIAAMGGEGGGVLTDWIVSAARAEGFPVQATSIPGVAQRTGATTYYIEIVPERGETLAGRQPVLSLYPVLGDVDIMVATEILEAARAVANGFVTPDRTTLIASTHRVFSVAEKSSMGDGRLDLARMLRVCRDRSAIAILFDMSDAAQSAGSVLNAVLLGALAGSGKLPIPTLRFEAAIGAQGKSVDSNLAGFAFGLAHAKGEARDLATAISAGSERTVAPSDAATRAAVEFDGPHRPLVAQAVARLIEYQDDAYAQLYLRRLATIRDGERRAGGDGALLRDVARHLAVRMCFEDVMRVAQLKIAPGRFEQVRREIRAKDGEPIQIVDYFKPGIEELCSMLPPRLALPILRLAERHGWLKRAYIGLHVKTNTAFGYARLKFLASLKKRRPKSHRYIEEQKHIDAWLDAVARAIPLSLALAHEIAECARLIKGYGDTHKRGSANWRRIEQAIVAPALAGQLPVAQAADAVANARVAALADASGAKLDATLKAIATAAMKPARAAE